MKIDQDRVSENADLRLRMARRAPKPSEFRLVIFHMYVSISIVTRVFIQHCLKCFGNSLFTFCRAHVEPREPLKHWAHASEDALADKTQIDSAVRMPKLLDIHSSWGQACYGYCTLRIRSVRSGSQTCAGSVGIDAESPSSQVLAILRGFGEAQSAGIQLVVKADRGSAAAGDRHPLGVGTGTGIEDVDTGIRMPQLLNVVSTRRQPGHGNLAAGIGGMGARDQAGAGRIGIDAEPPTGQVLAVLRSFCQADITHLRNGFQRKIGI